jgi:hypothetical protein
VGRTGTVPLIQHWDGARWSGVPAPVPAGSTGVASLAAVSATGPRDVWAVGSWVDAAGAGRTLTEHYDGTRWRVVAGADAPPQRPGARAADHLDAVTALGPDDVWAVGATVDTVTGSALDDRTVTEHWDGRTWAPVESPNVGTTDNLLNGAAAAPGIVWAVGRGYPDATLTLVHR